MAPVFTILALLSPFISGQAVKRTIYVSESWRRRLARSERWTRSAGLTGLYGHAWILQDVKNGKEDWILYISAAIWDKAEIVLQIKNKIVDAIYVTAFLAAGI